MTKLPEKNAIQKINYMPQAGYDLDLEIFPVSVLRQRVSAKRLQLTERIAFYMLIFISDGQCRHMVDFEWIDCVPGSLLILQPGQVHRFDMTTDWQGWILLYRPEFQQPKKTPTSADEQEIFQYLEDLPSGLALDERQQKWILDTINSMYADTQRLVGRNVIHAIS
ncbi:AraC family ligand binding domain-containing protein [Methylomonas sp. AM2-LC]|uniref:AraC family ligand binding domain-containing protein n=1 Tax=Methylomonas sp. AM2-LC TaxID=3153301 RepID=UPI0032647BF6